MTQRTALIRERQRNHWNSVASGWGAWLAWTRLNFRPLTAWLEASARWRPGAHVLDVGCGAGYPAIDAAFSVMPNGRVVAVDLAGDMIAAGSTIARQAQVGNIEWAEMDAEALRFADRTFDAVTNAYGLMFCPDPVRALEEARRVLVRGGRIAIAVWDEPSRNPFLTLIREAASDVLAVPVSTADEPHPFRLASADVLGSMLTRAGFSKVDVETLPMTLEIDSPVDYCRMFADLAMKSRIARLAPADAVRFQAEVARALEPHIAADGRVRLLATSLCASATRPGADLSAQAACHTPRC